MLNKEETVLMKKIILMGVGFLLWGILTGCGGGSGGPPPTGTATFRLDWPERSRLVPDASQSVRVEMKQGNTLLASRLAVPEPVC